MFTNYFMDDRKCFEDVLRMREFHELLSGLIHEFIKWFNMGWDPNIQMHLPFVFLIIILALKHLLNIKTDRQNFQNDYYRIQVFSAIQRNNQIFFKWFKMTSFTSLIRSILSMGPVCDFLSFIRIFCLD